MSRRTGKCLCGSITFSAEVNPEIGACHCTQCQRWSGGGPFIVAYVTDLEIEGEAQFGAYHASDWGERIFCKTCGSVISWRMQGKPTNAVSVGLLEDQSGLKLTEEIFVDYRPAWMPPFPGAAQSTEAEEMAKLKAYQEREGA